MPPLTDSSSVCDDACNAESTPSGLGARTGEGQATDLPAPRHSEASDADLAALRHLQQTHAPVLLSFLTRLTRGDVHRAEDIVQETVLRAWRNPDARNAEGQWSRPWLFTVAKRILIDQRRSADVRPSELPIDWVDAHADPDDAINRLLDAREVRAAVESLPERLRSTLVEIFFRERSVAEAAEVLGVPAGTVKSRTFHAVRALREALVSRGFEFDPRPRSGEPEGQPEKSAGGEPPRQLSRRSGEKTPAPESD